jgi:CRISPR/Cas system-associated exonuclease Cas4 (RecB family)
MSNSPLPDLVPARMVNEFVYCPRLAYLEWVQGDWADNADTAEGRFTHRAVDRPSGALPARPAGRSANREDTRPLSLAERRGRRPHHPH